MLVVISNSLPVAGDAAIINALFDEGLEVLHLRKPGITTGEMNALIGQIKQEYHPRIALHQHHDIADKWGIKRLHFTETGREEMSEGQLEKLKSGSKILSTSIHSVEAYNSLSPVFDYTFFGPVFNSISKQGYESVIMDDFIFPVLPLHPKVFAIGGIDAINIRKVVDMKFDGAAALGAIWQNPGEGVAQFKILKTAWEQIGQLC